MGNQISPGETEKISTEFHEACEKGDTEKLQKTLSLLTTDIINGLKNDSTGFQKALIKRHLSVIEVLSKSMKVSFIHESPLHYVIEKDDYELFTLLFKFERIKGTLRTPFKYHENTTPIQCLLSLDVTENREKMAKDLFSVDLMFEKLRITSYLDPTLILVTKSMKVQYLKSILDTEINYNCIEKKSGNTALHLACESGDLDLVKELLKKCQIITTNKSNQTPIHLAAIKGHSKVIEYLLQFEKGKLLTSCRDYNLQTPLMMGIIHEKEEVVKFLVNEFDHTFVVDKFGNRIYDLTKNEKILSLLPKKVEIEEIFKIQIASDIHLEFLKSGDDMSEIVIPKAPYLALLGDIGLPLKKDNYEKFLLDMSSKFKKVFILAGNHEYYHSCLKKVDEKIKSICQQKDNLIYIEKKAIEIDGVKIIGTTLWTKIDPENKITIEGYLNDFSLIHIDSDLSVHISADITNSWFEEDLKFIKDEIESSDGKPCIILTHHAPLTIGSSEPTYFGSKANQGFCSDLSGIMNDKIPLFCYGHTHWPQDMVVKGTRVISNPRGYIHEKSPAYDPSFVASIYKVKN